MAPQFTHPRDGQLDAEIGDRLGVIWGAPPAKRTLLRQASWRDADEHVGLGRLAS